MNGDEYDQVSSTPHDVFDWNIMLPYIQENASNIGIFLLVTFAISVYVGKLTKSTSNALFVLALTVGSAAMGVDSESRKQIEKQEMLDFKSYLEKLSNTQLELYVESPEINERSKGVAREVISGRKVNANKPNTRIPEGDEGYDENCVGY